MIIKVKVSELEMTLDQKMIISTIDTSQLSYIIWYERSVWTLVIGEILAHELLVFIIFSRNWTPKNRLSRIEVSDCKIGLPSERDFFLTDSLVGVGIIWQLAKFLQSKVGTLLFPFLRTHLGL
jgi:hypothetical protein